MEEIKKIRLFHGTSRQVPGIKDVISGKSPLIMIDRPDEPGFSGGLTELNLSKHFARETASRFMVYEPIILEYIIPADLVRIIGLIATISNYYPGKKSFISRIPIGVQDIPYVYFQNLFKEREPRLESIDNTVKYLSWAFYQAPSTYLHAVLNIKE